MTAFTAFFAEEELTGTIKNLFASSWIQSCWNEVCENHELKT